MYITKKKLSYKKYIKKNKNQKTYKHPYKHKNFTARIIIKDNFGGVVADKDTIKDVLESIGGTVEVIIYSDIKDKIKSKELLNFKKVNVQIFIEHVLLKDIPADKTYIFINQEWLSGLDIAVIKSENLIPLCKTYEAIKTLNNIGIKNAKYVKFGNNNQFEYINEIDKLPNLFIHIVGGSPLKGTKTIIDTWLQKNITYPLVITANNKSGGNTNLFNYWKSLKPTLKELPESILNKWEEWKLLTSKDSLSTQKLPLFETIESSSVYFCNTILEYNVIQFLQSVADVHICPSLIEGWGQYIDEGRRAKALVLTLDAPPMNELISDNNNNTKLSNGILVKASKGPNMREILPPGWTQYFTKYHEYNKFLHGTYKTTINDLYNGINRILKMSQKQRRQLGNNAYKQSLKDYTQFKNLFSNFILKDIK